MEILSQLTKTTTKKARRIGRGIGSKKGGHTTGRGAKGDKVRGKTKITFDGTKIKKSWIKRLPFLRGKHRLLRRSKISVINLSQIDQMFTEGQLVDSKTLESKDTKILSGGNLTKPLHFSGLKVSASARSKILAAGGKID